MQTVSISPSNQKGIALRNVLIILVVVTLLGVGGWYAYTHSDNYLAQQQYDQAVAQEQSGDILVAVETYFNLAQGKTSSSVKSKKALERLYKQRYPTLNASQQAGLLHYLKDAELAPWLTADRSDVGLNYLLAQPDAAASDRLIAYRVAVSDTEITKAEQAQLDALQEPILRMAFTADPNNVVIADELAVVYATNNNLTAAKPVLLAVEDQLVGSTLEGARILGQIYASEGEQDKAFALLEPYTRDQLANLAKAEAAYDQAYESASNSQYFLLNQGLAPESFYDAYDALEGKDAEQGQLVQNYVWEKIKDSPSITAAQAAYLEATDIVPVAIDLGILRLQRGQAMIDPAAREAELKAAEETFLAIQGVAGDNDQYKLYLGQVYYWLGKQAEGKTLFDEVLARNQNDTNMQLAVADVLRNVGDDAAARQLTEDAYANASNDEERYYAASMRAVINVDIDDRILWLERTDLSNPAERASLASTKAYQAQLNNNKTEAIKQLDIAIKLYADIPENTTSLNNSALVYNSMFKLTGEQEMLDIAADRMQRAVQLEPSDSILIRNAASMLEESGLRSSFGDRVDWQLLQTSPSSSDLQALYFDNQQREKVISAYLADPATQKTIEYYERLSVLAPKGLFNYLYLSVYYDLPRDADKLANLVQRMQAAKPDLSDYREQYEQGVRGDNDDSKKKSQTVVVSNLLPVLDQAKQHGELTHTVALARIADALDGQHMPVTAAQLNQLIARAEAQYNQAPNNLLEDAVVTMRCERAKQALTSANTELQNNWQQTQRYYSPCSWLFIARLSLGEVAQAAIDTNPDFQKVAQLEQAASQRFLKQSSGYDVLIATATGSPDLAAIKTAVEANPMVPARLSFQEASMPWGSTRAITAYYARLALGNGALAKQKLQDAVNQGAKVPQAWLQ